MAIIMAIFEILVGLGLIAGALIGIYFAVKKIAMAAVFIWETLF